MAEEGKLVRRKNLTNKQVYELVCKYVETGNYAEVSRETGIDRTCVYRRVQNFIDKNPEEYNKILDAFLMRNKMQMIHTNAHTTMKALEKVDELLDDTENLKDAVIAYGTLYDKGALMRGEATSNSAVVIKFSGDIEELSK